MEGLFVSVCENLSVYVQPSVYNSNDLTLCKNNSLTGIFAMHDL